MKFPNRDGIRPIIITINAFVSWMPKVGSPPSGSGFLSQHTSSGIYEDYKFWPGTEVPWEPVLDWRKGGSRLNFVPPEPPGAIGDGRGIGNWWENTGPLPQSQPPLDPWASLSAPHDSIPPSPITEHNFEAVRDSQAAAHIPSRFNVFEYGFPEPLSAPPPPPVQPRIGDGNGIGNWWETFIGDNTSSVNGMPTPLSAQPGGRSPPAANVGPEKRTEYDPMDAPQGGLLGRLLALDDDPENVVASGEGDEPRAYRLVRRTFST